MSCQGQQYLLRGRAGVLLSAIHSLMLLFIYSFPHSINPVPAVSSPRLPNSANSSAHPCHLRTGGHGREAVCCSSQNRGLESSSSG